MQFYMLRTLRRALERFHFPAVTVMVTFLLIHSLALSQEHLALHSESLFQVSTRPPMSHGRCTHRNDRTAYRVEDLDQAPDKVLLSSDATIAAPTAALLAASSRAGAVDARHLPSRDGNPPSGYRVADQGHWLYQDLGHCNVHTITRRAEHNMACRYIVITRVSNIEQLRIVRVCFGEHRGSACVREQRILPVLYPVH
jgi:hypothetical protein